MFDYSLLSTDKTKIGDNEYSYDYSSEQNPIAYLDPLKCAKKISSTFFNYFNKTIYDNKMPGNSASDIYSQ
ncbi:hypothetical protein FACS189459_6300 [Bacilli bacterium]|nr:hypothetical protein FACS189459_6300 [Bacilli bacterium]